MTWIIDEQISALLDGELPAEQESLLLTRLEREPESRAKLARYGLIGELLRDHSAEIAALSISERVSAALAAEQAAETTSGGSVTGPESSPSAGVGFAGAAIAASIALVVMFSLGDIGGVADLSGADLSARSVSSGHDDHTTVDPARLTRYMMAHAQFSNTASRQLVNSHVAMAAVVPDAWASHD